MKRFIVFDGDNGIKLYLNPDYISRFYYDADQDATNVYITGEAKPIRFNGDVCDEIANGMKSLI